MCKYDYPKILAELEHTEFNDVLDCGCGTGPMIAILSEKYPNPRAVFDSVYRVLRKGDRLILRDYTSFGWVVWLMNHVEMPLANLCGHGDVKVYKKEEYKDMIKKAGFSSMMIQAEKKMRCHVVATK